ncbi:hypothetical protein [Granulosicoccus antarcticus]|uniref:Uncharacterized protein n=1 Tax=Granulosicoccus antarcticus IMCC3135 TaxID=1192854 RepID=A0A2Z2P1H7_9GAMM|nr:hypothetical protein [Granulosicoccus antarcticus]ASJ74297.1 hypothetical protein IMCC3135_21100 [Granulosicoccus antarcticus IMCC3135]
MKTVSCKSLAAIIMSFQLLTISGLHAEDSKVPEKLKKEVVETETQTPEQEKSESGEASGNIKDCEKVNESDKAGDGVEQKDIDDCGALIK